MCSSNPPTTARSACASLCSFKPRDGHPCPAPAKFVISARDVSFERSEQNIRGSSSCYYTILLYVSYSRLASGVLEFVMSDVEDDHFALPPWKRLMQYQVVVCSCLDAEILVSARCTNRALAQLEEDVCLTLRPSRREQEPIVPHWTHLLIDEVC